MKRLTVVLLIGVCLIAALPYLAFGDVITLTLTDQNPENGWGSTHALAPWIKKVEEATGGRVKIQPYFSQTLAAGKDSWAAVKNGIADMAWCPQGSWPGMTPLAAVVTLGGLPLKSAEQGSEILWKLYEKFPEIRNEYKDNHVLVLFTSAPFHLITVPGTEVRKMEDLKGMRIRTFGSQQPAQMKAVGAVPMSITMPDTYMALQKGVVNGMCAPFDAIYSFRHYEVAPNFTYVPIGALYFSIVINKNKWNSLPKDIQEAITSVSGLEAAKFFGKNYFDSAKAGVLKKAEEAGYKINEIYFTPEQLVEWAKISGEPLWDAWVKQKEADGHKSAREVLNTALEWMK